MSKQVFDKWDSSEDISISTLNEKIRTDELLPILQTSAASSLANVSYRAKKQTVMKQAAS